MDTSTSTSTPPSTPPSTPFPLHKQGTHRFDGGLEHVVGVGVGAHGGNAAGDLRAHHGEVRGRARAQDVLHEAAAVDVPTERLHRAAHCVHDALAAQGNDRSMVVLRSTGSESHQTNTRVGIWSARLRRGARVRGRRVAPEGARVRPRTQLHPTLLLFDQLRRIPHTVWGRRCVMRRRCL
jgi:hypothetical protein